MATNLGLEASIYHNSAKQNIAWFNCLANKCAVPVSAGKNKSLGENFWNLSTKVEKIMQTPNLGLWRSALRVNPKCEKCGCLQWNFINMLSRLRKILRCHHWKFQSLKIFLACTLTSFIVQRKFSLASFDQPSRHLLSLWLGLKPVEIYFTGMKMWFS